MTELQSLWLPILLSAVFVFIASSIIQMATPWHRNDYPRIPNEDKFSDALRPLAIPPGDYMTPRCDNMAEMNTPEFQEKMKRGPVMMLTVLPNGPPSLGKPLLLWFVYCIIVGIFAAYIAGRALPVGSHYLRVFQFVGATAFMGYVLALWQYVIWYGRSAGTAFRSTVDGLIYACLTAGTFGWLWPK